MGGAPFSEGKHEIQGITFFFSSVFTPRTRVAFFILFFEVYTRDESIDKLLTSILPAVLSTVFTIIIKSFTPTSPLKSLPFILILTPH